LLLSMQSLVFMLILWEINFCIKNF
jgi:hypothetical protein